MQVDLETNKNTMAYSVLSTCNNFGVGIGVASTVPSKLILMLFDGRDCCVSAATVNTLSKEIAVIL